LERRENMGKLKQKIVPLTIGVFTFLLLAAIVKAPEIPPLPMTVNGYVFIRTVTGQNVTAPAGLQIFAKIGTETLPLVEGSKNVTDENGYYSIGIAGPKEGTPIDIWVERVNVTRIILQYYTVVQQNLTVIDTEPPSVTNLHPKPKSTIQATKPTWINATITDNLAVNSSTIKLTLNGTELTPTYIPETGQLYYQTEPLAEGLYNVKLTVKDIAGNTATETWNFTAAKFALPAINIIYPTATKPTYTQPGRTIQITYNYTEASPKNATITVYNSTNIIRTETITNLAGGTNITRTDSILIPAGTAEGSYNLNVTIYNIYELSATATQLDAIIVDNTKPVIVISYPVEGSYISAKKVWINGTITEVNIGTLKPSINDTRFTLQEWNSATGKFAYINNTAIPDGKITLTVTFTDLAQNTASATRSFTLDTTAPVISRPYQNPPGKVVQPAETVEIEVGYNITVKVNVTDLNLEKVYLYYNVSATQWKEIQMNPTTGNEYTATIPSSSYTPTTTIQYYIKAVDKAGNTAQTPTAGAYFQTKIIPEFPNILAILLILTATILIAAAIKRRKPSQQPPFL
jgi:hypothetical protein